jgi:hypothetical protein
MNETVTAFDYVFPVVGSAVVQAEPLILDPRAVYGTAFYLADDIFVTAAHVIDAASEHDHCGLGATAGSKWRGHRITELESLPNYDLAFLRVPHFPTPKAIRWESSELPMLEHVQATGFPYALNLQERILHIRAFRGHTCSSKTWASLQAHPRVYELSFHVPRGLSGAPLWTVRFRSPLTMAGIVFGNSRTDMIVCSERESLDEGTERTVYERVESLHLGLALQSQALLLAPSAMLGTTLNEYLKRKDLLA